MSLTLVIGNKNYSSWSLRPWLFLRHHDIDFEEIRIPLYRSDSKPKLLHYSPTGKVPLLLDGDIKVWESLAILEYLAERFPYTQGWPSDSRQRVVARSLAAEMHAGFTALRTYCGMNCHRPIVAKTLPESVYPDIERVGQIWQQCRQQHHAGGPWLFGKFGIVDAMFAPVALRFNSYQIATNSDAQAYVDTVLANPAVKAWIAAGKLESEVIAAFE